jgi:hypothetical protein
MNERISRPLVLLLYIVFLLIPLNVYLIGERLGAGIQWAFFRYQDFSMGSSIISLSRDFEFVSMGIYTGKSALMVYLWGAGVVVLLLFLIILLVRWSMVPFKPHLYGIGLIIAGILFLGSSVSQYGVTFSGPAGFVVPFGALIMIGVGGWIWWQSRKEEWDGEQDALGDGNEQGDEVVEDPGE